MSTLSTRRYLSVWLRRLSTDRIERRLSAPADGPRVVTAAIKSAQRIVALNDEAARLGLKPGMTLADARAMYPSLPVADADTQADRRLLEAVADWCDRYTPLVGLDPPDGLALDITGCAHLFGGEAALARDLIRRLALQGFRARAAVADTIGAAWAIARYGEFSSGSAIHTSASPRTPLPPLEKGRSATPDQVGGSRAGIKIGGPTRDPHPNPPPFRGRERAVPVAPYAMPLPSRGEGMLRQRSTQQQPSDLHVLVVPRGESEAAILSLPAAALRLDPEIAAELATVGLRRVADLATRPRAPLAARFGERLLRRLDQALGREDEPITPRLPLPVALAEQRFAEPVALEACVLGTIEHLAHQLADVLERRGEGARLIGVALFRSDGKVHRLEIGTGAPLRDPARVRRLFEDRLATLGDACDPGFGYDVIRLSALATERCDPVQTGLHSEELNAADRAEELAHLIDRLGARFGLRRVTRLVPQDTHIPEFAVAAVPAHANSRTASALTLPPRSGGEGRRALRQQREPGWGDSSTHTMPPHPRPLPTTRFARGGRGDGEALPSETQAAAEQDSLSPARPIRLFARPEPVEAMAEVPDGPPVRFRWRQVLHEVAHAEGPERIAMQWWRDDDGRALTRDYFRVESRIGARVWLYREGLYGRETERPRWYLHGLFA